MSNAENFLARWSRRKHAATGVEETRSSVTSAPAGSRKAVRNEHADGSRCRNGDSPALSRTAPDPPFDPLSLPSVESIVADTDIRGFLDPGVSPELTRAGLRRAWAADPKIRDFVGLADYDWDFNATGTMAGFASLEMTDELRRMAAQIIGQESSLDQTNTGQTSGKAHQPDRNHLFAPAQPITNEEHEARIAEPEAQCTADLRTANKDASAEDSPRQPEVLQVTVRRAHGGALPK
jgi:hypothetical protein